MEKDYLTIPEAAKICSVARSTMWRWVKEGYVTSYMTLGGQHRIRKVDLEAVLAANRAYRVLEANREPKPPSNKPSTSHARKILIVDDDPQIPKMMAQLLEAQGYETDTASDGFEAGVKIMDFKPDLIILDLVMPGMDGFEVCQRIKENRVTAHIKVLAVSGYDTEEDIERIIRAGADGFLAKPIGGSGMLETLKEMLNDTETDAEKTG